MRNGGAWTEARWRAFVKGGLRSISNRWPPKGAVKKQAWRGRGVYECAGYGCRPHIVGVSVVNDKGKRVNNVFVDHIDPVVDVHGFTTWDDVIERLFCEADGLQVLCGDCHSRKTADERVARKNNNECISDE